MRNDWVYFNICRFALKHRLPSASSFVWVLESFASHDPVATAHHLVGSGGVLVAIAFVVASRTGVCAILAQSMGPAIVHSCYVVVGSDGGSVVGECCRSCSSALQRRIGNDGGG